MTDSQNMDFAWDENSSSSAADFPTPDYAPDRWATTRRDYTMADVEKLRGSIQIRHTLAEMGAKKLWKLITETPYVNTLGAFTGLPGHPACSCRPESHLSLRLAGCCRRQQCRPDVS